jgi:hypothetical protein
LVEEDAKGMLISIESFVAATAASEDEAEALAAVIDRN